MQECVFRDIYNLGKNNMKKVEDFFTIDSAQINKIQEDTLVSVAFQKYQKE